MKLQRHFWLLRYVLLTMSRYHFYWSLFLMQMFTVCDVNIMFYNNKWKFSEKAAAVSLFQSEESADADVLHKNDFKFIEILVSTYFQAETSITLIRMSKIFYVILSWSGVDAWQVISRVHCLSKMGLFLSVKLFSFNAIFDMINVNCQVKWTLFIMYNNKYTENAEIVNLTDFKNNNFLEENDFNKTDDGIWEMKVYKRLKVLILNCCMFYFEFPFKDLYCVASYDVFLVCFHLPAKVEGYSINDTHTQNSVQIVFFFFLIVK